MTKFFSAFALLIALITAPAWGQQVRTTKQQPTLNTPATVRSVPELMTPTPSPAPAVTPVPTATPATVTSSTSIQSSSINEVKATPEMWFYQQNLREAKDPKNAVWANAAFAAQQRANRLAAMKWFGLSNSRPRVSPDPVNVYPPAWSSNTPMQPNRWQATGGQPYYVARPDQLDVRSY